MKLSAEIEKEQGQNKTAFVDSKKYFATPIQEFVYYDKYSRFDTEKGRRETWPETVQRVTDYLRELSKDRLSENDYVSMQQAILDMEIAPSMRLMSMAGSAARRTPESLYNCCYIPMNSIDAIVELLWVSMCGVGAGYSIEDRYTSQLPGISARSFSDRDVIAHVIPDTTEGWVEALRLGLARWVSGKDVVFDYSRIRPAGSVLKTKGGTASGPEVLIDLLDFVREIVFSRAGTKLMPIDVFDICTKIGDAAVSGGSRRSAQLCMFDLGNQDMMLAKSDNFWENNPHRANANISVVLEDELSKADIKSILSIMFNNNTGEPGIVSRHAMNETRPSRRREMPHGGVNACSEINLHGATQDGRLGAQFCNLSSINVYPVDTVKSLERKVVLATMVGTIQSMATNFKILRPEWKEICEEERLLGVSMVGILDNEFAQTPEVQQRLRVLAKEANKYYAEKLQINSAAAITTIKPAGNSSVMYGTARGINARYAPEYIRRVRVNKHTPIFSVLDDSGMRLEKDVMSDNGTWVASFYQKSPENSPVINDMSALKQLNVWKTAKLNWAEHNISVTIEYEDSEKEDIVEWIYNNQGIINGIAFLPRSTHTYEQAPYEEITIEEYGQAMSSFPQIDFSLLALYENSDTTERGIECSADGCDLF